MCEWYKWWHGQLSFEPDWPDWNLRVGITWGICTEEKSRMLNAWWHTDAMRGAEQGHALYFLWQMHGRALCLLCQTQNVPVRSVCRAVHLRVFEELKLNLGLWVGTHGVNQSDLG